MFARNDALPFRTDVEKMYDLCCMRYTSDNLVKCKEALLFSVCCDEASPTPEANTTAASVQICPLLLCISEERYQIELNITFVKVCLQKKRKGVGKGVW